MPREPRVFKLPRPKPEPLPEPEPLPKAKPKPKSKSKPQAKAKAKPKSRITPKEKQQAAGELRQNPSPADLLLREKLSEQEIEFQFREIVHGFIPNFYFPQYKKAIVFNVKKFRDKEREALRDNTLKNNGIKVSRINPQRFVQQTDRVMEEIIKFLTGKPGSSYDDKSEMKAQAAQAEVREPRDENDGITMDELSERLQDDNYFNKTLDKFKNPY